MRGNDRFFLKKSPKKSKYFWEVGWRGAPVTAGDWRLRAVATPALGIPSLARGGKLSQTSDRLYSCGFADRQSRPWSATGAGGFWSINSKLQIPISFWLCSTPQGYAPFRTYRDAVSMTLQGRPRLDTYGWEHNGQPQATMDDNRRKAFMYSTNFRISKKYNLFRNRPVIYNLYEIKL